MVSRKVHKLHIKTRFIPASNDEYVLVKKRAIDKIAGNPKPKYHFYLTFFYFSISITLFATFFGISDYTVLNCSIVIFVFIVSLASGIYQFNKYEKTKKLKKKLEKIKEEGEVIF